MFFKRAEEVLPCHAPVRCVSGRVCDRMLPFALLPSSWCMKSPASSAADPTRGSTWVLGRRTHIHQTNWSRRWVRRAAVVAALSHRCQRSSDVSPAVERTCALAFVLVFTSRLRSAAFTADRKNEAKSFLPAFCWNITEGNSTSQ
jgi:hypothetical protein